MAEIKETLGEINPWWKKEFRLEYKERDIYSQLQKFMKLPQIIALTGLRRVGKTTIMYKMIRDAINSGIDPKNIIYFSFDEFSNVEIRAIPKAYEDILDKDIKEGKYFLFLDEIQKLDNWENQLKALYDTLGKNIKIIISGSESLSIKKKSRETLAGRIFEFKIDTLSFREFLYFKGIKFKPINLFTRELSKLLEEFILTLGFPELVGIKDKEIIKKYIKEGLIEKIIYSDMPKLYKIKDITILESILRIFTEEPGQLVEISSLAGQLKISRQSLANYLNYLEDAFLIRKLYNWSRSQKKIERKLKKIYPAIISVDLLFKEDELSKSRVFEWLLVNQLKGEFFWRDPYKNEVDVILPNKKPKPVEIKYGKIDFNGLLAFMHKFKIDKGYVISRFNEETKSIDGKQILIVPSFKFLLTEPYKIEEVNKI